MEPQIRYAKTSDGVSIAYATEVRGGWSSLSLLCRSRTSSAGAGSDDDWLSSSAASGTTREAPACRIVSLSISQCERCFGISKRLLPSVVQFPSSCWRSLTEYRLG